MKSVYEFIKKCNVYYLATVDGDQARVRPFGTVAIFDEKLYIQTGKVKDVSKQIHADPKVELSCFDGEKWLRLSGTLEEDDRLEAKTYMLDCYPELKAMYSADDGNTEVFYFKDAKAVFSSFTASDEIITW